jgi:hypothetical protein
MGLRLLEFKRTGDVAGWEKAVAEQADTAQTLHRFVRAATFLADSYPDALKPQQGFAAGSAVMLEFIQLHELSAKLAQQHSAGVFAGKTSVREVRKILADARGALAAAGGVQPQHRTQRYADFSQHAIGMLTQDPGLLNLAGLKALHQTGVRHTLMPKLVAETGDGEVAVDVRAPDVTAARTLATGAALIAARVAVLRLRFERVIVAMPEKAEPYALETLKLLKTWAAEPAPILANLDFLLIGDDSARLLQKPGL